MNLHIVHILFLSCLLLHTTHAQQEKKQKKEHTALSIPQNNKLLPDILPPKVKKIIINYLTHSFEVLGSYDSLSYELIHAISVDLMTDGCAILADIIQRDITRNKATGNLQETLTPRRIIDLVYKINENNKRYLVPHDSEYIALKNKTLACGSKESILVFYPEDNNPKKILLENKEASLLSINFDQSNNIITISNSKTNSYFTTINLINTQKTSVLLNIEKLKNFTFSPDGNCYAFLNEDNNIYIVTNNKQTYVTTVKNKDNMNLVFNNDTTKLLVMYPQGIKMPNFSDASRSSIVPSPHLGVVIIVYDINTDKIIANFTTELSILLAENKGKDLKCKAIWHPNNKHIAIYSKTIKCAYIVDIPTRKVMHAYGMVEDISFNSDGSSLFAIHKDAIHKHYTYEWQEDPLRNTLDQELIGILDEEFTRSSSQFDSKIL